MKKVKQGYEKFNYGCGDVFGRLTLTGSTFIKQTFGHRGRIVEAVCKCGVVKNYWFDLLRKGETQSCGCLRKEVSSRQMTTHNLSGHPLYQVHVKMIKRCYDPTDKAYKNYGGRGIEVWKDWKEDFICFYDWCIENGWKEGLSLDRRENDGHYAPYNCRIATYAEQNRNKRNNRMFTAFGETKCLWDWGKDKRCAVSVWALRGRIDSGKWGNNFEGALKTKEDRKKQGANKKDNVFITAFGETKCMKHWLSDKRCVVKLDSLRDRFRKGWVGEKIITTPPHSSGKKGILLK